MILNTYAVLAAFLSLLRLLVGMSVLWLGFAAWRHMHKRCSSVERGSLEDRSYLLSLLGMLVVGLSVASWPLLYLLLQSYVPECPGAMCIYGVTQVGSQSEGVSHYLPVLLIILQALKPVLVFAGGSWLVLYLVNRRTTGGTLLSGLFLVLGACGILAICDAGAELAYLSIPRQETGLASGCCAGVFEEPGLWEKLLAHVDEGRRGAWLSGLYLGNNVVLLAWLGHYTWRRRAPRRGALSAMVAGAVLTLVASGVFLVQVAAPTVLHLPYHHCPYDLVPGAPEMLVGVLLALTGTSAIGWAWLAAHIAAVPEAESFLGGMIEQLLFFSLCCYLGSLVLWTTEVVLA